MSTSPYAGAGGHGRRSNFTQTCNLLSQFLKDKRSSAASTPGITASRATAMDLLTNLENSDRQNAPPMDSLPQFVENACIKHSNLRSPAPETPQLAIFYAGKVLVFDAFPPEKATEVMELATNLGSDDSANNKNLFVAPVATENLSMVKVPQTNTAQEGPRPAPHAFGSDMRYPRRASLVKFLEKRKERVIARGPYQMNNPKHEGSSSGGDPEDQSPNRFDLNL